MRRSLPLLVKDENGVPLLHSTDPKSHFERLAVFFAYRNIFPNQDYSGKLSDFIEQKVTPLYGRYRFLTRDTSLKRLIQVLTTMFNITAFHADSVIRQAVADISDEQIWNRDKSVLHRLPLTSSEFERFAIAEANKVTEPMKDLRNNGVSRQGGPAEHTEVEEADDQAKVDTSNGPVETKERAKRSREELESTPITSGLHDPLASLSSEPDRSSGQFLGQLQDHESFARLTARQLSPSRRPTRKQLLQSPKLGNHQEATPFNMRHLLLSTAQHLLEEACFYFAERWLPDRLRRIGWVTPEQGELNRWWGIIVGRQVPAEAVDFADLDVKYLFREAAELRHAAVHRLVEDKRTLEHFLQTALLVLLGLKDYPRAHKLKQLQDALQIKNWELLQQIVKEPLEQQPIGFQLRMNKFLSGTSSQTQQLLQAHSVPEQLATRSSLGTVASQTSASIPGKKSEIKENQDKSQSDPDVMEISSRPVPIVIDLTMDSD